MIADTHIHSYYSYDSINSPRMILKIAKKRGLDTVVVADHNSILGGINAAKEARHFGIDVIVGDEILTDVGDVIGIYLTEEITTYHYMDVIDEIHDKGGVAILPHPYRGHKNINDVAAKVDIIEVWNGRNSDSQNQAGLELAQQFDKKICAGSDAHLPTEIGCVSAEYDEDFEKMNLLREKTISKYNVYFSQLLKRYNIPRIIRKD